MNYQRELAAICCRRGTFTWAICNRCSGNGHIVNPSIDGNGLTREDFEQDPDFEEAYFSGMYDIPCPDCVGGKVRVPNVARLTFGEKRQLVHLRQSMEWDYGRPRPHGARSIHGERNDRSSGPEDGAALHRCREGSSVL